MNVLCLTSQRATLTNVRPEAEMFIGLQQSGCKVTVMTEADSDYAPRMRDAGIEVIDFRSRGKFSLRSIREVRAQLPGYDIAYAFTNPTIANTVRAARDAPVKVVTYRGQTGNLSRFDPTSYLTHLHPRVDAIICVADAVRASVARELRDPHKAVTVYKGHDLAWYRDVRPADRATLGVHDDAPIVLCVSNYRPRKGLEWLIESFSAVATDAHLLLAGNGTDSEALAAVAARCGLEPRRFHALGHVDDVLPINAAADIAVLAALKREGLPKSVIEAMALGVAPVVSDTGGNAELVEHGVSGLVVPPGDTSALTAALGRLLREREERAAFAAAARERIGTHFTTTRTVRETLAVFERLLQR